MPAHVRSPIMVAAAIAAMLLLSPDARANYEYNCGAHRGAQCHEEPRADEACYSNQCYGRCGPGCDWGALGYAYTPACGDHDACIQYQRCVVGTSGYQSHVNCAGGLPGAVASWAQTHWNNWFQHARDTWSGLWTKVRNCCG